MNVVICRVRVFDFSKPLQGTSPTLIGPRGWYSQTNNNNKKKRVQNDYNMEPKKASGKRKNGRVEKESGEKEKEGDADKKKKNPFCWLRNKTDRVGYLEALLAKLSGSFFRRFFSLFCFSPFIYISEVQTEFLGTDRLLYGRGI